MTETPLPKLVFTLAIPTMISMLISSFYNMADTYFVGQLHSVSATGAVGVAFPLMTIMQAVGFTFGQGSGNYMARALGAEDRQGAQSMAITALMSAFVTGIFICLAGYVCLDRLPYWLGSTDTIAPYAKEYIAYLLLGAPFLLASLVMNNQLRFQGSAFYSMIGISSGAVLNIVLDPIFIFVLDMGIAGAALATSISQMMSFFMLYMGTTKSGNIHLKFKYLCFKWHTYQEILRGGIPSLARQGIGSVGTICLNLAAGGYGDVAIAAMSIVSRVMQMAASAVIGFGQGFQPICGFNYGAKCYGRLIKAFWYCVKVGVLLLAVVSLLGIIFAPSLVAIFMENDAEVQAVGAMALRWQCLFLPIFAFVSLSNMMLQTIGMPSKATLLASCRQGLCFIPSIFVLEHFFGLFGVQIAQSVADILTFLIAVPLATSVLRSFREKQNEIDKLSKA